MDPTPEATVETGFWAILELMGHRKLTGYITEVERYGGKLLRIDVPGDDKGNAEFTQLYGCASIYCITPTTEAIAKGLASRLRPAPVHRFELPAPDPLTEEARRSAAILEDEDENDDCFDDREYKDDDPEAHAVPDPHPEIEF